MSKTTLDLSTLSDIADGAHTVKVKAKADGYRDSEFSNVVSYTKAPSTYKGTITLDTTRRTMNIHGYDSSGTGETISLDKNGAVSVSGYVKYGVTPYNSINDYKVTGTTNCTYVIDGHEYIITPSANGFTFTFTLK